MSMALAIRAMRNNLGKGASPYYALASWSGLVESEDFIDRMAATPTTLSKTDIVAVFQLAREELSSLLAEGYYVKTPLGSAIPRASGKLATTADPFQPNRADSGHELRFDFKLDPAISREALAHMQYRRKETRDIPGPRIYSISSIRGGLENRACPGELIRIRGLRLKFDPKDETQGLFLRPASGEETRVYAYAHIMPSLLIAQLPEELAEGNYRAFVRSRTRGGTMISGEADGIFRIAIPSD
jgi:hypothetical protein